MCDYGYTGRFNDIANGFFLLLSAKDPIFLLHALTMTQHLLLTFCWTLGIEDTDLVWVLRCTLHSSKEALKELDYFRLQISPKVVWKLLQTGILQILYTA